MIASIANSINEIDIIITFVEINYEFEVILSRFILFKNLVQVISDKFMKNILRY